MPRHDKFVRFFDLALHLSCANAGRDATRSSIDDMAPAWRGQTLVAG